MFDPKISDMDKNYPTTDQVQLNSPTTNNNSAYALQNKLNK